MWFSQSVLVTVTGVQHFSLQGSNIYTDGSHCKIASITVLGVNKLIWVWKASLYWHWQFEQKYILYTSEFSMAKSSDSGFFWPWPLDHYCPIRGQYSVLSNHSSVFTSIVSSQWSEMSSTSSAANSNISSSSASLIRALWGWNWPIRG